jgi:hypothetical protein
METGLKEAAGTARVQGRGAGKDRKQEAGTARRQGSGFRVQGSGFRVQERHVKSSSFPRKRESKLAPD